MDLMLHLHCIPLKKVKVTFPSRCNEQPLPRPKAKTISGRTLFLGRTSSSASRTFSTEVRTRESRCMLRLKLIKFSPRFANIMQIKLWWLEI